MTCGRNFLLDNITYNNYWILQCGLSHKEAVFNSLGSVASLEVMENLFCSSSFLAFLYRSLCVNVYTQNKSLYLKFRSTGKLIYLHMHLLYGIYNQICRKLIQSTSSKRVLVLTSCKHEHRFSLTLVCSCQRISDLSHELFSLRIYPGERTYLLPEKNQYLLFYYSQAVISLSTVPLIRAL